MKSRWRTHAVIIILMDQLLLLIGYAISVFMIFGTTIPEHNVTALRDTLPLAAMIGFFLLAVYGTYSDRYRPLRETLTNLTAAVGILAVSVAALAFFNRGFAFPRSILVMAPVLQLSLLYIWHGLGHFHLRKSRGVFQLLVVGNDYLPGSFLRKIEGSVLGNRQIKVIKLGVAAPAETGNINDMKSMNPIAYEGSLGISTAIDHDTLNNTAKLNSIGMLIDQSKLEFDGILLMSSISHEIRQEYVRYCAEIGKLLLYLPKPEDVLLTGAEMLQFADVPVMSVEQVSPRLELKWVKRIFDIVFSLIAFLISSPFIFITAMLVKLSGAGPVFFVQERVTKNGKTFTLVKFRTMVHHAEKSTGPVLSSKNDPRITPVGRFLRKSRFDELPQLWNILCGHMSLVGPRPERPVFVEQFEKELPGYNLRHSVQAGLTGMAQVYGNYSTSAADKLVFDLVYIRDWSLWLDLQIVLKTVTAVFRRDAAEGIEQEDNEINEA